MLAVDFPIPAGVDTRHKFSDLLWRENIGKVVLIKYDAQLILNLNFVSNMVFTKDEDLTAAFLRLIQYAVDSCRLTSTILAYQPHNYAAG